MLTRRTRLFREQHPNIQVEEITGAGGSLNEKVLALFAAGTPPDLLTMNPAQAPAGGPEDLATRGMLLKLDARIKQDRALRWDDVWPSARGAGQYEGAQLTLPSNGFYGALLFFNKELFGAGGQPTLDQLVARKEWTWQTLAAGAARLTKREPTGELVQAGIGYPWFPKIWATMLLRAYGADYMDSAGTKLVIDSPRAVDALRVASEIASRQRAMALPRDGNIQQLVQGGRIAQSLYWMAAVSWWRPTGFDWDVAPAPAGPAGTATAGATLHLGIARELREPDASWLFAGVTLSPEVELDLALGFGSMALRQSNLAVWRQQMRERSPRPQNLDLFEQTARSMRLDPLRRMTPQLPQVDALYQREVEALLVEGKPPDQVVKTVATEGSALLAAR